MDMRTGYWQTGTGKTHTIWGQEDPAEQRGVNFRTLEALFADASSRAKETQYSFYVSMLEVYNDQLRDLVRFNIVTKIRGVLLRTSSPPARLQ